MDPPPYPIGHRIVCTNGEFPAAVFESFRQVPMEGRVYTVADLFWATEHGTGAWVLSVRLAEFPCRAHGRAGFSLWRFRLLDDLLDLEAMVQPLALSA